MVKSYWSFASIPDQNGKLAIVTGGGGGLGTEISLALAQKGAMIILIDVDEERGAIALDKIKTACPNATVTFAKVDLMSLGEISEFARRLHTEHAVLDILINNAGILALAKRETTEHGHEKQFATNYLGHFTLTALLLPALRRSAHARVVNVGSLAHRWGKINFEDLQCEKSYNPWLAYSNSKLATLLFTMELQKRSDDAQWGLFCVSAHPGYSRTNIYCTDEWNIFLTTARVIVDKLISQSAAEGALPILFAATSPEASKGGYYGPNGFYELYGTTTSAYLAKSAQNENVAKRLWKVSSALTGTKWI